MAKATCEGCVAQRAHLKRDDDARVAYRADRDYSEAGKADHMYVSLDLQKVRMLPEIPGVKSAVFTRRICAYNETFTPLGKGKLSDTIALIWHQGVGERNDEEIVSCFKAFLKHPLRQQVKGCFLLKTSVFDFIRANRFINKAIRIQCSFLENLGWVFRKQFFDAAVSK